MTARVDFAQIKTIHALKNALKLTEEEYRLRIIDVHGFSGTSKDLTYEEAQKLIRAWANEAIEKGLWENRAAAGKQRHEELEGRDIEWATPKQCRLVEAMFRDISIYKNNEKAFKHALRNFLQRIAHVEQIRFLKKRDVSKVVKAIERMKQQPPIRSGQGGK